MIVPEVHERYIDRLGHIEIDFGQRERSGRIHPVEFALGELTLGLSS